MGLGTSFGPEQDHERDHENGSDAGGVRSAVCYSSMMPTRTQIIVCWLAFTGVMALLSILLHAFVPGLMTSLQDAIGVGTLGVLMLSAG